MRTWTISALALAVTLAGCSDRTGVIIQVTRDVNTTPADMDALRVYVGVAVPDSTVAYVDTATPDQEVVDMTGRDLAESPYRLLLTPHDMQDNEVRVAAVGLQGGQPVAFGQLPDPVGFVDGQVLEWTITLTGDQSGGFDVTDTGCLIVIGTDSKIVIGTPDDRDCDGDAAAVDCNDNDPTVGPTKPERCANGVNDDCDGMTDEIEDVNGDGVDNCSDCDDQNNHRYPGNTEVCDGLDNDCNDLCDDGPADPDGDTYTTCGTHRLDDGTCAGPNDSLIDCQEGDAGVNPGAEEVCDGVDNNCNGVCDDGFDPDGDHYTECGSRTDVCNGTNAVNVDCEPDNKDAFPGNRPELCDGVDNDCDGVFYPAQVPCYVNDSSSGENVCVLGKRSCDDASGGGWGGDCLPDANSPAVNQSLCDAYDACQDAPDPFACANGQVTATTYACTIYYPTGQPNTVCQPAAVALPNNGDLGSSCRWFMHSAGFRPRYDATLFDGTIGPSANTLDVCAAAFAVRSPNDVPPPGDAYMLLQTVDGAAQTPIRLQLTPMGVTDCPAAGLDCQGLTPIAPAN